jgi:stalled ribosome rescue protein Dom34
MASYIVWIDRQNAKVFKLGADASKMALHWAPPENQTHGVDAKEHESEKFYHSVASKLQDAKGIVIVGPGIGRTHFKRHLDKHDKALAAKVLAVESADHPTDGQLRAFARKFFNNPLHAI